MNLQSNKRFRRTLRCTVTPVAIAMVAGALVGCGEVTAQEQESESVAQVTSPLNDAAYLETAAKMLSYSDDVLKLFDIAYPELTMAASIADIVAKLLAIVSTEDVMKKQIEQLQAQMKTLVGDVNSIHWHDQEITANNEYAKISSIHSLLSTWAFTNPGQPIAFNTPLGVQLDTLSTNLVQVFVGDSWYYWPTSAGHPWAPTTWQGQTKWYDWRIALFRELNAITMRVMVMHALFPDFQVSGMYRDELIKYRDELRRRYDEIQATTVSCYMPSPGPVGNPPPSTLQQRCRNTYTNEDVLVCMMDDPALYAKTEQTKTRLMNNAGFNILLSTAARLDRIANGFDIGTAMPDPGWKVNAMADFDGNGKADLVWRRTNETGEARIWLLDAAGRNKRELVTAAPPSYPIAWRINGVGDFDRNGTPDLVLRRVDDSGEPRIWFLDSNGSTINDHGMQSSTGALLNISGWRVIGVRDFNRDAIPDLWLQRVGDVGEVHIWTMGVNGNHTWDYTMPPPDSNATRVVGMGDFDKDGVPDLVWRNKDDNGGAVIWRLNADGTKKGSATLAHIGPDWRIYGVGDFDGDGTSDLLWRRSNDQGEARIWFMKTDGTLREDKGMPAADANWRVIGVSDFLENSRADVAWRKADDSGEVRLWWQSPGMVLR